MVGGLALSLGTAFTKSLPGRTGCYSGRPGLMKVRCVLVKRRTTTLVIMGGHIFI